MTDGLAAATPPDLPAEFWERTEIRTALASRHFGRFLRAYRTNQSPQVKQAEAASWLGITQGQLSKIERSSVPLHDLDKLTRWTHILRVPVDLLWFTQTSVSSDKYEASAARVTVEEQTEPGEGSDVRRRDLFKVAGTSAAVVGTGHSLPAHGNG